MVLTKEDVATKGAAVTSCMLDTSMFTVLGVGTGLAICLRTKSKRHFVYATAIGTVSDLFVGYYGSCRPLREDYLKCKESFESENSTGKLPSNGEFSFPQFTNWNDYTTEKPKDSGEKPSI